MALCVTKLLRSTYLKYCHVKMNNNNKKSFVKTKPETKGNES